MLLQPLIEKHDQIEDLKDAISAVRAKMAGTARRLKEGTQSTMDALEKSVIERTGTLSRVLCARVVRRAEEAMREIESGVGVLAREGKGSVKGTQAVRASGGAEVEQSLAVCRRERLALAGTLAAALDARMDAVGDELERIRRTRAAENKQLRSEVQRRIAAFERKLAAHIADRVTVSDSLYDRISSLC